MWRRCYQISHCGRTSQEAGSESCPVVPWALWSLAMSTPGSYMWTSFPSRLACSQHFSCITLLSIAFPSGWPVLPALTYFVRHMASSSALPGIQEYIGTAFPEFEVWETETSFKRQDIISALRKLLMRSFGPLVLCSRQGVCNNFIELVLRLDSQEWKGFGQGIW